MEAGNLGFGGMCFLPPGSATDVSVLHSKTYDVKPGAMTVDSCDVICVSRDMAWLTNCSRVQSREKD